MVCSALMQGACKKRFSARHSRGQLFVLQLRSGGHEACMSGLPDAEIKKENVNGRQQYIRCRQYRGAGRTGGSQEASRHVYWKCIDQRIKPPDLRDRGQLGGRASGRILFGNPCNTGKGRNALVSLYPSRRFGLHYGSFSLQKYRCRHAP